MARYKTFVNGGSLTPADLNGIQDNLDAEIALKANASNPVLTGTTTLNSALVTTPAASQNASYTLTNADKAVNPIDTSTNAVTVTLPAAPTDGLHFEIFDATGGAAARNITIARNGKTINGTASNLVLAANYGGYQLVYSSTLGGWVAVPNKALRDADAADWEYAFSTYKTIGRFRGAAGGSDSALANWLLGVETANISALYQLNTTIVQAIGLYLDPAEHNANARTTKVRLRVACVVGATAPGTNATISLCRVATWTNGQPATVSAALASTTFVAPAAGSRTVQVSADATLATADFYVVLVKFAADTAAGAAAAFMAAVQIHQV